MDGDQNAYKDEFSAAPQAELAYVSPVSPPILFVRASKEKPQQTASMFRAQIAFICVKLIVEDPEKGAE